MSQIFVDGTVSETISAEQHLQLIGLMTLASQYKEKLDDIEQSIRLLVDEQPDSHGYYSFSGEMIWECSSVDEMNKFLKARGVSVTHLSVLELVGWENGKNIDD